MKFDPNLPFNDLPELPPDFDFRDTEILIATIKVSDAVADLRTRLTMSKRSIDNALDLLSPLFVPEAVASSGIENIITTSDSVYVAKIKEIRELLPAEKEALNYTESLMAGARIINEKGFLATNDYIRLQGIIEPEKMGIRDYQGTELKNPITGKIYYTPPVGQKIIRDKLTNYEKYFNEKSPTEEIFARMAVLHYQFEMIHPFGDGNGRTGRILMPLYLTLQRVLPVPVLFISQYILNHRDEYYQKLRDVTRKNRWKDWVLYILQATEIQAKYTSGILAKIQTNIAEVKNNLRENFRAIYSSELVDFLFSRAYFTQKEFEKYLGISQATAGKYLKLLEKSGFLHKERQFKRNRFLYINPRYVDILKNA